MIGARLGHRGDDAAARAAGRRSRVFSIACAPRPALAPKPTKDEAGRARRQRRAPRALYDRARRDRAVDDDRTARRRRRCRRRRRRATARRSAATGREHVTALRRLRVRRLTARRRPSRRRPRPRAAARTRPRGHPARATAPRARAVRHRARTAARRPTAARRATRATTRLRTTRPRCARSSVYFSVENLARTSSCARRWTPAARARRRRRRFNRVRALTGGAHAVLRAAALAGLGCGCRGRAREYHGAVSQPRRTRRPRPPRRPRRERRARGALLGCAARGRWVTKGGAAPGGLAAGLGQPLAAAEPLPSGGMRC